MSMLYRIGFSCIFSVLCATGVWAQQPGGGGSGGSGTVTQGTPNTAANAWPIFATVGGTAISATNGIYSNILQGNVALGVTNGLYSNVLQGNVVLSATNGLFSNVLQGNAVLSATNGLYSNILQGNAALSIANPLFAATFTQPLTNAQGGNLTPVVSSALEASHSISGAKNLYSAYVVSTTGAAGYFVCINATSISPGAITPVDVVPILAGSSNAFITYGPGPTANYGTGITCAVTTAATPFTYTSGGSVFYYHILAN